MNDFARAVDWVVPGALNPGEQVLWKGHCLSRMGKQKKATAAIGAPAAILALSLAAAMGLSVCLVTRLPLLGLISLVATGIAVLYLTREELSAGVQDSAIYCRKQTVYVLTNQRAMVLRNCRTPRPVRSVPWAYVEAVQTTGVQPDGRGTLEFLSWDAIQGRRVVSLRFFMTGNVKAVADRAMAIGDAAPG